MSITTKIEITSTRPILDVLNQFISAVNSEQRLELDNQMKKDGFEHRAVFLKSDKNKGADGDKLWSNGAHITSYNFFTFAIIFGLNGSKAIMVNVDGSDFQLSINSSKGNDIFMEQLYKEINKTISEDVKIFTS